MSTAAVDDPFVAHRSLLFTVAYEMLGSAADAEDVLQESWLRWAAVDRGTVQEPRAYLVRIVTRQALNHLRTVSRRREEYVGEWLPEPLLTSPDVADDVELAENLSIAMLTVLETLGPAERAVFVLREVFGFDFGEVASAVGRSEAACRQLAVRARRHMDAGRPRFEADRRERERLAGRFFEAFRDGDVEGLRELLAADVQLVSDSGGKAPQWGKGVFGADKVARVLAAIVAPVTRIGVVVEPHPVNGQPGAIFRDRDGKVVNTWTLDIADGQVQAIRTVLNPDKLAHVGPVADAWAVVREATRTRRPAG
jgi:RNA polymerase sigma-70 factor (ECF subfamily)